MLKQIDEKVTPKEAIEMVQKGLENYSTEKIAAGTPLAGRVKNNWADIEKQFKEELEKRLALGDQLSLDFGEDNLTYSMVELDDISFDCDESTLHSELLKAGHIIYLKNGVNTTAIKKDYKNGSLHPDIVKHIVITKQQSMKKSTKKIKKDEEE